MEQLFYQSPGLTTTAFSSNPATDLTSEQQATPPSLLAATPAQISKFIACELPQLTIIRPGEFCISPTFVNDLNLPTIALMYRILKGGPRSYRVDNLTRRVEQELLLNVNCGNASALKVAVTFGCLAVYSLEKDVPERGFVVSAFARTLTLLWNTERSDKQLDGAIYYFRKTVETEPIEEVNLYLVNSSYFNSSRSLKCLLDREVSLATSSGSNPTSSALLLRMLKTPNNSDLPHAATEVSSIRDPLTSSDIHTRVVDNPTRNDILEDLKEADFVHFARHGVADLTDPSLSMVLIRYWITRPLNVRCLLQLNGLKCKLVYLFSCESTVGKDRALKEEGIHLSGGFHMAGVPHVVRTMWKVDDKFRGEMAKL